MRKIQLSKQPVWKAVSHTNPRVEMEIRSEILKTSYKLKRLVEMKEEAKQLIEKINSLKKEAFEMGLRR